MFGYDPYICCTLYPLPVTVCCLLPARDRRLLQSRAGDCNKRHAYSPRSLFVFAHTTRNTCFFGFQKEALEAGCRTLLLDEDTCATNAMSRDARMAALVAPGAEPITPLTQRVGSMIQARLSLVLVMGSCGEYFEVADSVVVMTEYRASDVTRQVSLWAYVLELLT